MNDNDCYVNDDDDDVGVIVRDHPANCSQLTSSYTLSGAP